MRISTKLIIHTVIVAVSSVVISSLLIGWMSYNNAQKFLRQFAEDRLISLRDTKANQIRSYFDNIEKQIITFANNYTVMDAMQKFSQAFNSYLQQIPQNDSGIQYKSVIIDHYVKDFAKEYARINDGLQINTENIIKTLDETSFALQYNYIFKNPYAVNNKSKYDAAPDYSDYNNIHKQFHPLFREYQEKFGYKDILLIDPTTGRVVYSVTKNVDYSTSLINGPYTNTGLGNAFYKANTAKKRDFVSIDDFVTYLPTYGEQMAFIATPIFDKTNTKVGVLIFSISNHTINKIMTSNYNWEQVGLGKTGESYLIGPDYVMRSMSRFKESRLVGKKVDTYGALEVTEGKTDTAIYYSYLKQKVVAAYEPLNIKHLNWGIICELNLSEAFHPIYILAEKIAVNSLLIVIIISAIAIMFGIILSQQISRPIEKFSEFIIMLARTKDLTKRINVESKDELGNMAKAINALIKSFQDTCKETIKSTAKVQAATRQLVELKKDNPKVASEAAGSLHELSGRLQNLSNQFRIFEEEADRIEDW